MSNDRRPFSFKMKNNYVTCQACEWQLKNCPDHNWRENPCHRCNNTRKIVDPKELLCNMCGGCMCPIGTHNEQVPHGLFNAKIVGGYDSYHLFDMTSYTFSICEKCLRQIFMQFKIPPTVRDVIFSLTEDSIKEEENTEVPWEQDVSSYEYKLWRDRGGHHQAYLKKLCNTKKDCPNKAVYTVYINDHFTEDSCCEDHKSLYGTSRCYKLVPFITNVFKPYL